MCFKEVKTINVYQLYLLDFQIDNKGHIVNDFVWFTNQRPTCR
jgi:hypothetical protein